MNFHPRGSWEAGMFRQPLLSSQHFSFLFSQRIKHSFTMEGGNRGKRQAEGLTERKKKKNKRTSFDLNQTKFTSELYIFSLPCWENQYMRENKSHGIYLLPLKSLWLIPKGFRRLPRLNTVVTMIIRDQKRQEDHEGSRESMDQQTPEGKTLICDLELRFGPMWAKY